MVYIKSVSEVEKMRRAGQIVYHTFEALQPHIKPGVTTKELDTIAKEFILSQGAKPSFLNYNGFPASICASVNNVVIHGIPSGLKLKDGDIISLDIGAFIDGHHGDACRTYAVGNISDDAKKLGAPVDFSVYVRDVNLYNGAGFITVLLGNIMTMPGLPKIPNYEKIYLDDGKIVGLS